MQVEDAEEITQDVFVTIYQKSAQFKNQAELSTWIYRITVNKALDFCKHKKRKKRWFLRQEIAEYNEPSDLYHPGFELEDKESISYIFKCIHALNEQQKTALILTKIDGFSQKEAAEIMGISPKAVESLIQRAKENLKNKGIGEG